MFQFRVPMEGVANNNSLSAAAYDRVRAGILSGEYPLGCPLSRRRLAAELNVSLVPVAEALRSLEQDGLVESLPRVGTRVKIPTPAEVRGKYILREALESQSARLFASMAGPAEKRAVERLAKRLDRMALRLAHSRSQSVISEYEREHTRFHRMVAECSRCHELVEAIELSRVLIFNWLLQGIASHEELFDRSAPPKFHPLPEHWHEQLVNVLCAGDALLADESMRLHVNFRRDEFVEWFETVWTARNGMGTRFTRGPQLRNRAKD